VVSATAGLLPPLTRARLGTTTLRYRGWILLAAGQQWWCFGKVKDPAPCTDDPAPIQGLCQGWPVLACQPGGGGSGLPVGLGLQPGSDPSGAAVRPVFGLRAPVNWPGAISGEGPQ